MTIAEPANLVLAPEWETVTHTVACPLCDYNLRGLVEPRCPECGYRFEWAEVIDPSLRPPPYLFEHAQRRPVRSFLWTQVAGFAPTIFFGRLLRPTHPVRPDRLLRYWVMSALLVALLPALIVLVPSFIDSYSGAPDLATALRFFGIAFQSVTAHHHDFIPASLFAAFLWLAWPWVTLAALLLFRDSMNMAKVKAEHVLRCAIYCCDSGWLMGGAIAASYAISHGAFWFLAMPAIVTAMTAVVFGTIVSIRLACAYRLYLRFPHAVLTAVLSQIIVLLAGWLLAGALLR
jgi:hypothetical protein